MATMALELRDVVDRLAAAAADGTMTAVRGDALVSLTQSLLASVDRAGAVATHATGLLHASGDLTTVGFVSTKRWLQQRAGLSERDAKALVARSRSMRSEFSATWEAWNAGDISGPAAREISIGISSAFRRLRSGDPQGQRALAEKVLLDLARTGTVDDVRAAVDRLRHAADADGANQAAMAAFDCQALRCSPVGEMQLLDVYLTAESAALVTTAVEQIVDEWYRAGSLPPEDLPAGTDPDTVDADAERRRSRRRPHLRALALVELARRQLENGELGSRHGVKPHLTITTDLADLLAGRNGELALPGREEPTAIAADTVRRILCDCSLSHVLTTTDPDGGTREVHPTDLDRADLADWLRVEARTVLYVGRASRTVPPRLRKALQARDRHCAFPGCRVSVDRTDAHHVREWEQGGPSDLDNLVLLCVRHHHYVHEGGWTITAAPDLDPGHPKLLDLRAPTTPALTSQGAPPVTVRTANGEPQPRHAFAGVVPPAGTVARQRDGSPSARGPL